MGQLERGKRRKTKNEAGDEQFKYRPEVQKATEPTRTHTGRPRWKEPTTHHPPSLAPATHRQRQRTERRKELRLGSPLLGHRSTRYACNGLARSRWAAELVRNFDKDTEQREPAEGPVRGASTVRTGQAVHGEWAISGKGIRHTRRFRHGRWPSRASPQGTADDPGLSPGIRHPGSLGEGFVCFCLRASHDALFCMGIMD